MSASFGSAGVSTAHALRRVSGPPDAGEDLDAAVSAATAWLRAMVGQDAAVALAQPDGSGRLRVVWRDGEIPPVPGGRSTKRRAVYGTMLPMRVRPKDGADRTLALFPLHSRHGPVGVLEVLGDTPRIEAAWGVLEVGARQLGVAVRSAGQVSELRSEVESLERVWNLGAELVRARTAEDAVRQAVRFVWEWFRIPVAGWCHVGGRMRLVGARGLKVQTGRTLRETMSMLPPWGSLSTIEQEATRRSFGELAGLRSVFVLDAGDAVLLTGRPSRPIETSLDVVGSLLAEVVRLLDDAAAAEQRKARLDMGIAWTAHELRGPLLGVRAVLELLSQRPDADSAELSVLGASLRELDHLAGTAESLLAWAVGTRPLQLRRSDLVKIVEEAVESCLLEAGGRDVAVLAPSQAIVRIDPPHLRTALVNLVRNALAYSDPGTQVLIRVEDGGDQLMLSVEDVGPMIPPEERRTIFDPFIRGSVSGRARNGSGLGLFIARRIVEGHGGRIWVDSRPGRTTFRVSLPVDGRSERRFAS